MTEVLKVSLVNGYLAHKQHLLPTSRLADVVQVTRDIVALHATAATGPISPSGRGFPVSNAKRWRMPSTSGGS
jgi:hypothetical protein